jgi:methionyl-tRNA formyltransferase
MRILFMGTGEIGIPCLEALLRSGHEVCGVVTQPDRPVGRRQTLTPPKPKVLALAEGLPVFQPERMRDEGAVEAFAGLKPEVIVVVAYGQILPLSVLALGSVACINVHASLLPRHRGAACIQAPIVAGDRESGVTIMHVAKGLDTGDIIVSRRTPIGASETGGELHDRLGEMAPSALMEALAQLENGTAPREVQDESQASYARKLLRGDGEIDWTRSAIELERMVRAYDPWPGTFTCFRDGKGRVRRLKLFPQTSAEEGAGTPGTLQHGDEEGIVVACGEGVLRLQQLQPEGSRRLSAAEFLAGHELREGDRFFSLAEAAQ